MIYYLQIDYEDISNIIISTEEDIYYASPPTNLSVIAQVSNLENNQIDKLVGCSCNYYISKLSNAPIEGVFYKDGDTLKIKPKENMLIRNNGTYRGYIMIKEGIYNGVKLPTIYSNEIVIKAFTDINPSISVISVSDYPGSIKYKLTVQDIVDDMANANVYIVDNEDIEPQIWHFDATDQSFTSIFEGLPVGSYVIKADISYNNANYTVSTDPIEIKKSQITYEIKQETKNVLANPFQTVSLVLMCSGNDFTNFDENKFTITVDDVNIDTTGGKTTEDIIEDDIENNIEYINNNKNIIISFCSSTINEGRHTVGFQYEDDNFTVTESTQNYFDVQTETPDYSISLDRTNENNPTYKIQINNHHIDIIPIKVNLNDAKHYIITTDEFGSAEIEYDSEFTYNEWCNFESITLEINPDVTEDNMYDGLNGKLDRQKNTLYQPYNVWFTYFTADIKTYQLR